jgi:branched-chain amino acid transport system ATP-binding protein
LFQFRKSPADIRNRGEAERLVQFVGLEQKGDVLAGNLSYGEQKLLALACVVATRAQTIFLDEPMAGVHPEMAARLLRLILGLRHQGKLIVFIEHDLDFVRVVAEQVIVMDQGRVIAYGAPEAVLTNPEVIEAYVG